MTQTETREQLVERVTRIIDDDYFQNEGYTSYDQAVKIAAEKIVRLLTTRVPDPDADVVERLVREVTMREVVSEAMNKGYEVAIKDRHANYKVWEPLIDRYTDAALAAAGDDYWLYDALNSVGPAAWIDRVKRDGRGNWCATVVLVEGENDIALLLGDGPTRKAAILDAVAKARKEAQP